MAVRKRTRRSNGEGTVFADKVRGGWVGLVYIDGKRRKVRGTSRTDALAAMNQLRIAQGRGRVVPDGNATVQSLLDQYAKRVLPNRDLAPASRENYGLALRVLGTEFGKERIAKLSTRRVEAGLDHIATGVYGRGRPLGKRSMKLYRETFVQALDKAVANEDIPRNYAEHASLPVTTVTTIQRKAMTTADALKLWAVLDDGRAGAAFKLMMTTTMRPGEAYGLCWDSIDVKTGELTLRRAVRTERGRSVLVEGGRNLKTVNAERRLIAPAPALEAIRAQKGRIREMKIAAPPGRWPDPDPGLVFPTAFGGPWNPKNARDDLTALCELAGVPRVSPNELRHTAKALLDDAHVDPVVIRNVMGHSNEWMQDSYGNRARRAEDGHVAVMDKLFGS
jgi:integrase